MGVAGEKLLVAGEAVMLWWARVRAGAAESAVLLLQSLHCLCVHETRKILWVKTVCCLQCRGRCHRRLFSLCIRRAPELTT